MIAEMPARRVRLLRLTAPDEALARRGALLLEDALRTATLPGGDGGRLVVVRSLALGKIDSRGSPASVALALEQRWRHLAASAIHAEDPSAPHRPAVFFRDRAEALALLALRVAAGGDTGAWFWPLVVPGWRPDTATEDAFRLLLAAALDGAPPEAAVLALVAALFDQGALSPFLAALRPGDGPALLAAFGLGRTGRAAPVLVATSIAPHWTPVLAQWGRAWGLQDARTLWLAAAALAVDAPARLLDPGLAVRAERVLAHLAQAHGETSAVATPDEPISRPPPSATHEATGHASPAFSAPISSPGARARRDHSPPHPAAPAPALPGAAQRDDHDRPRPALEPAGLAEILPAPLPTTGLEAASYTRFAGLALALPLLARLGIADAILADPKLADLDLPGRILGALARGARIPATDPIRATVCAPPRTGRRREACPFDIPVPWRSELANAGAPIVRAMAGRPDVRVLCEAGGRLALALWHEERSPGSGDDAVCSHPQMRTPLPAPLLPRRSDVAVLVEAWQIAVRRWLAVYAGMTLGALIRRPGYVAVTRTHLDVFFPLDGADIRVRRAGLDLDPGWLGWYGRVVLFHYVTMPWNADRM